MNLSAFIRNNLYPFNYYELINYYYIILFHYFVLRYLINQLKHTLVVIIALHGFQVVFGVVARWCSGRSFNSFLMNKVLFELFIIFI